MKRFTRKASLAAAIATVLFGVADVHAEGYALNRYDPAPAGDRLFGVQDPGVHGDMELHVGLQADYAFNPYVLTHTRGLSDVSPNKGSVVEHQMFMHLNGSFALWNKLNINLDVPLAMIQDGESPVYKGVEQTSPTSAEFGDLRIGVRGALVGERHDPFQLGVSGYFWIPTGASDSYVSDNMVRGTVEALLGGEIDPVYWNFGAGVQIRESKVLLGIPQGSMFQLAGGVGVMLGDEKEVTLGPEFKVGVTMDEPQLRNINGEVLLGAKYRFLKDFRIGAAGGPGVTEGHGTPDFRGVLSFEYTPDLDKHGASDSDGDGLLDDRDACPAAAGPANADPSLNGCPAMAPPPPVAAADGDGDGVPDDVDACPALAGLANADATQNGCPGDSDGDGVRDDKDACPTAAPAPGMADPAKPGCSLGDSDGDGVPDGKDACPAAKGIPGGDGCPGDSDGDGIRDDKDACPAIKGKANDDATKNGCPTVVRFKGNSIVILKQVQFATGTAIIKRASNVIIEEVSTVLKNHPEILKVEISGHTDNKGSKGLNDGLSQRRANAVMKAVVARGVEAGRLVAKGYGPDKPIADNNTDEGRTKNRRVEFNILERKKK